MAMAGLSLAVSPRGRASPGELSVTGFDDTEIAAHLQPSLTTVSTDVVGLGPGRRDPAARADRRRRAHPRRPAAGPPRRPRLDRPGAAT